MSSAMDSLMSTVDTITSADSDDPSATCAPLETSTGFVAKSPPSSPKDSKLASSGVSTRMSSSPAAPPPLPPGATSSLLSSASSGSKQLHLQLQLNSSPTNTASSLKTRSFDGLIGPPGLDATSTTTTVSTSPSVRGSTSDENAFLFLGCVQALLGVLMAVFGVLAMLHHASMASSGAGIWGGAISFVSGK